MTTRNRKTFGLNSLSLAVSVALAGSLATSFAFAADEEGEKLDNVEKIAKAVF